MREILFRGKRVYNNEWVEGFYVSVPEHYKPEMSGKSYVVSINNGISFEVIPETVRQYTGLTDKNGKKIFEGDIVKEWSSWWRTHERIEVETYEVVCRHLCALGLVRKTSYGEKSTSLNRSSTVEVIGNIHDNPELLEEDKQ